MSDFLIKNTILDHSKVHLHRVAAKLETEPLINGLRLRPRQALSVPVEWVERNHAYLEVLAKNGVIEIISPDGVVIDHEILVKDPEAFDDLVELVPEEVTKVLVEEKKAELVEAIGPYDTEIIETPVPVIETPAPTPAIEPVVAPVVIPVTAPTPTPEAPKGPGRGKWNRNKG